MKGNFYATKEYRKKQALITKENWNKGIFDFQYKKEIRRCARKECGKEFKVIPSDKKIYCSKSCSCKVNNKTRVPLSKETRKRISKTLKRRKLLGIESPLKGAIKVARIKIICKNPKCQKPFLIERWMKSKFCSNSCAMAVIGGRPTSPRASRGKAGIRIDINKSIYFYSRWEANVARLLNYLGISWIYQPKSFNLVTQNYTPDFYLPEFNVYIEVKNFLWKYSKIRDRKFRNLYPDIRLILLLKKEYLKLEDKYSKYIKNWEYKNSPFQTEVKQGFKLAS